MRIRRRLALWGAAVVGIAMLLFGSLFNVLAQTSAPNEQDKALAELADQFASELADAPAPLLAEIEPPVRLDLATASDPFVAVVDEAGSVLYSTGQIDGAAPIIPAAAIVEALGTGSSSVVYSPTPSVELNIHARSFRGDAVVVAGQSTAVIDEQLQGLTALFWIVGIITTVAAIVVSWLVAGRALRPLRRLANTTEEIRDTGDLSRRLPPAKNPRDEVGVLTASFNGMLESLQSARHGLSDALAGQRRFVADASHEIRSPLTSIRNNAEFLKSQPDAASSDRSDAVADIVAEGERMSRLVDDLLVLASADAGRAPELVPVDLASVAADAVRRRETASVTAAGPAVTRGDRESLERLVVILLDNAEKYGGGAAEVMVSAEGDLVTLTVADRGPGIDPEAVDRVFDRFFQGDTARSTTGFGLGLAIGRETVTLHGGTITAANRDGGGAVFVAVFPAL